MEMEIKNALVAFISDKLSNNPNKNNSKLKAMGHHQHLANSLRMEEIERM